MSVSEDCGERAPSGQTTPSGRGRLNAMSREELQHRCRTLLSIAQRAKLARDEAVAEAELMRIKLTGTQDNDQSTMLAKVMNEKEAAIDKVARLKQELGRAEERIVALTEKLIGRTPVELASTADDEQLPLCVSSADPAVCVDADTSERASPADAGQSDHLGELDSNINTEAPSSQSDRNSGDLIAANCIEVDLRHQLIESERALGQVQAERDSLLQRHNAVLSEMNTMNETLRSRGETVARLSEELACARATLGQPDQAQSRTVETSDASSDQMCVSREAEYATSLRHNLRSSVTRVSQLETECSNLRKKMEVKLTDDQSEVRSCSTVLSRAEDDARVQDADQGIEEHYERLKLLAIKYKRKLSAVNSQLQSEHQENLSLSKQLSLANKELTTLRSHAKNIQALQLSHDQMQDRLDEACSCADQSSHQLDQAAIKISQLSQNVADLTESRDAGRKHTKTLEENYAAVVKKANEFSAECEQMKGTVDDLKSKLRETKEDNIALQNSVNQLENSTLAATADSEKLRRLEDSCEALRNQLEETASASHEANGEKQQLSEDLDSERRHSQSLSLRLQETVADRDELSEKFAEAEKSCFLLQQSSEHLTMERERLTKELADITEKHRRSTQTESSHKIENQKLQNLISRLNKRIYGLEEELGNTIREFSQYKVRAQAVLKSARDEVSKDRVREEAEQMEEVERARAEATVHVEDVIQVLRQQLQENNLEMTAIRGESDRLQVELSCQRETARQLKAQCQSTEQQCRSQVEQMKIQLKKEQVKFQREKSALTQKIGTLTSSKQSNDSAVVWDLHRQIEDLRQQLNCKDRLLSEMSDDLAPPIQASSPIDFCSMEREAAEGSERVTPVQTPAAASLTTPIPLEKLLSTPFDETADNVSVARIGVAGTDQVNRNHLTQELETQQCQISHLGALLHDSETSNVRLTQLCDTLKEEVRRLERSVERGKHLEKLEYLKNVTIKFVTLTERDERARLLPVLTTLLNLSPAETASLHSIIHGTRGSQTKQNEKGWSSYLPLWSGSPR